uniref:Tox-SGS domain-containing protein n=1 Tax=Culex quinquefasciatus TaxID=7176 RepID=A0A1S4JKM6_CULQU
MLRVSEFKKSPNSLGDPVGREVCVKYDDRKKLTPVYVKYGRDLAKVTNLSKDWNVTVFDSSLNQAVLPWMVIPGSSDKRIVFNTNEKGLKLFSDKDSSGTLVDGGASTKTEDLNQPDSAVHLISANGKVCAMTLDDNHLVQNFKLLNGKLEEQDYPEVTVMEGKIIPVIKSSGDTEYLAHCSEKKLTLYNLIKSGSGKSERSIKMNAICQKLFYTENKQVLLISNEGLHVLSLADDKISPSYYCSHFSKDEGWTKNFYDTIQLVKVGTEEVLISTGPNGIQAVKISNECKVYTIQDDPDKIKHVAIGNAVGKGPNQIEVTGYYNTELYSFTLTFAESQVIPEPTVEEPQQPPQPTAPKPDSKFKLSNNFAKPTRWLVDTLDESHFRNTVNKLTGRVELAFPLVDLQDRFGVPIKLMAYYREGLGGEQTGVLGRHWTLGRDCIVLDDKGSVFGEMHEYFLVKDQVRIRLVKREVSGEVLKFEVEGNQELSIEYSRKEEKWIASNSEVTYVYGVKGKVTVPAFENWFGVAANYEQNKIDHAVQWNLIEISRNIDKNVKLEFSYEAQGGRSYVTHLSTIKDNLGTVITLKYSKNIDSRKNPYKSESKKKVKWHNFDNNKLLTNIEIETPSYTQKLLVNTTKIKESYYLHEISQQADGEQYTVVKFDYTDQNSNVKLNQIRLPSDNKLNFEYKNETISSEKFQQNIGKLVDFFTGPGYSVKIALQNGDKSLKIDLKDNAGFNNFVKEQKLEIIEGKRIASYKPILQQNYLAIVVDLKVDESKTKDEHEDEKILSKIYLFDKDDGQMWTQYTGKKFEYEHLKSETFRSEFQENLVMYFDSAKINFITWNARGKKWNHFEQTIGQVLAVTFFKNGAVYYSDGLNILRINDKNKIISPSKIGKTSEIPNMKSWESFFTHIDVQAVDNSSKESTTKDIESYRKQFARLINDSSMVMYNNLLVARTIELAASGQISLKLYLYLLSEEYAVVHSQIVDIPGEDLREKEFKFDALDEYRSDKVNVNDLEQYTFKFVKEKEKFKLKFEQSLQISTGKKFEPTTEQKKKIAIMERMMKIPLDFERYTLQINSDGVIYGNQLIYHDGSTFKTSPLDEKSLKLEQFQLPVGDSSVLKKESVTDNLKFCTKFEKEDCSNLETSSARNVSIKYPHYFISQNKETTWVHVLKPNGKGVQEKVSFPKEMVHRSSSHSTFVATKLADNSTHVRPFRSISNNKAIQVEVVSKESLKSVNGEQSISYEYQDPVLRDSQVMFKTTLVIPGSNKKAFGFYQESVDFITNEQVVQVMDSKGDLFDPEYVKRMNEVQEEQRKQRDEPEADGKQMILDKSGTLPILSTKPYVKDDRAMISFFSFEDYESGEGWTFPKNNIVRNEFAATGRNYLKLSKGQSIIKNFSQLRFDDHFVFSSWIRTAQTVTLGVSTDMMTLTVKGEKPVKGIIKLQINDWIYIEADTSSLKRPLSPKIDLTAKIAATEADLHVDHVRLTPLNFNFEARVYDSRTSQRVVTIHNNGRVTRFVHDDYSRRIAEIDELGGIKYFATYAIEEGSNSRLQMRPKVGFVESFSPYTAGGRWKTMKEHKVEPGKIRLNGELKYTGELAGDALSVRMMYDLLISGSFTVRIAGRTVKISTAEIKLNDKKYPTPSKQAELIILATTSLTTVWIEGIIILEEQSAGSKSSKLSITSHSEVEIRDLIVMESPQVFVSYLNHDSKPIQEIMLEDGSNILVRQLIYDEIGRKVTETIWTRIPIAKLASKNQGFLTYKKDFVTNDDLSKPTSFLKTNDGKMTGLVHDHNKLYAGYPYSQIVYHPNPLEIRHKVAQPGELYSIKKGSFLHTFDISSSVSFINSNYPTAEGFRCEEERKPNGMTQVTVYNRRNKKVAEYIAVRDYKNALTTYLYDEFGNEIQKLPPKFYETSRTGKMSPEKVKRDTAWATNSEYNKEGSLLMKRSTPDGGLVEFIYDDYNQLRYQLHYNEAKQVDKIVYFRYNLHGQVYETGWLNATAGLADELRKDVNADLPERSHVLYFDYGETDSDPAMRGRTQRVIKQNGDLQFKQVLFYDEDGNVLRKSFLSQNANETLSLDYLWKNDQITGIRYPFFVKGKQLVLRYEHNLRGEVTSISLINDKSETPIVKLGHDAQGKVTEISHQYGMNKFNQSYEYEAPGYLKIIKNPYLTETLYYTEKGYGAEPVGDGSILRTEFHAMWHNQCDQNLIPLTARAFISDKLNAKMAELCFDALLERGYFDGQGRPLKSYYPDLEVDIPIKCSTGSAWEGIATGILERGYPEHYGHAYDYGSHSELVAAKYFVGEERDNLELPWKAKSFEDQLKKELSGAGGTINLTQVWNELNEAKIYNRVQGVNALFTDSRSKLDSSSVENVAHRYYAAKFAELSIKAVPEICRKMLANINKKGKFQEDCSKILESLNESMVNPKLLNILNKYPKIKKNIFQRLLKNLAATLGNSPADVESFSIDSNGNHGTYYTGFKRFELIYKSTNNQIATIKKGSKPYDIAHDSEGNIIKAAHKDIDKLKYDPLTQRVSKIEMTSKKLIIEFGYDHLGERVVKRVRNTSGDVLSELYYVRDSNGNTLVEYKLTYPNPKETSKPIVTVTAYIHGPLGLVGFFRNDKYYSVLLDHEGSTRLVIHQNRVVAAYDYMPYGQLMRKFGSSAEAHIAYRYTGQEYDEETGLYNYHARLYDPDIGRFYQLDPMEQYPSPYKYAGNSPVSQIDPDGQVAITLIVIGIGALLGAYFGAASANNSWNPAEWDWANKRTWIGLFAGALAGGFAAYGGLASFAYLTSLFGGSLTAAGVVTGTLAAGGAFLGAAAATNEWDPHKWDWTSPIVWNGLLTGTAVAVSLPSGFVGISRTFYSLVSNAAKILYGSAMISGFLLLGYVGGALANNFNFRMDQWDWKNPRTWFGIIEGSATVIMATGGTVKHGAFKTHFITSPGKLKGAWYRINIPAKSFTVKETPWKFFITYYKNGQKVGSQIIDITTRKGLRSIPQVWQGTTKYFFISNGRIAAGMVAMGSYTFAKYHNYRSLFEQYPNETQKIGVKDQFSRSKRYALNYEPSASNSASRTSFFCNLLQTVMNFFTERDILMEPILNHAIEPILPRFNSKPESTQQFSQKLCYSPKGHKNYFICPQR